MHESFITHQDDLLLKLQELETCFTDVDKKYLHLKSVHNFIIHFSEIENTDDKTWIYNSLHNYLTECHNIALENDRSKSEEMYTLYIDKIADYYSKQLNFSIITSNRVLHAFSLLIIFLTYLFFDIWVSLLLLLLFVFRRHFIYNKKKQNKVYGLFY